MGVTARPASSRVARIVRNSAAAHTAGTARGGGINRESRTPSTTRAPGSAARGARSTGATCRRTPTGSGTTTGTARTADPFGTKVNAARTTRSTYRGTRPTRCVRVTARTTRTADVVISDPANSTSTADSGGTGRASTAATRTPASDHPLRVAAMATGATRRGRACRSCTARPTDTPGETSTVACPTATPRAAFCIPRGQCPTTRAATATTAAGESASRTGTTVTTVCGGATRTATTSTSTAGHTTERTRSPVTTLGDADADAGDSGRAAGAPGTAIATRGDAAHPALTTKGRRDGATIRSAPGAARTTCSTSAASAAFPAVRIPATNRVQRVAASATSATYAA